MLEESISCSPGCETKRSQSRRLHERFKGKYRRRKNRTSPTDVSCLEGLYEESNHILDATQYEHFNPFENEQVLAAADMVRVPKSPPTLSDLSSRGFVKLEDLPVRENDGFQEDIQEYIVLDQTNSESHAQCGPETQFGITESEFVRFCDDAEMDVKEHATTQTETPQNKKTIVEMILEDFCASQSNEIDLKEHTTTPAGSPQNRKTIVEMILEDFCASQSSESQSTSFAGEDVRELPPAPSESPQKKKSIVERILEDFCASPYNESPPKLVAENATPVFRFRSKSIRTYAGSRRLRRNIETELESALTDDDGCVSDSSGLSVQEDLTQSVVPQLDTVDLNSSIKVCENLLHLSSYFSQTTSQDKTPQSSEEQRSRSLSGVLEEIMQLKGRSYGITRRKSEDEFRGFSDFDSIEEFYGFSDEERKSREDIFKELLEDEDDILQQINCDSLCYEKAQPKASFSDNVSQLEIDLEKAKSVIEDSKKFLKYLESLRGERVRERSLSVCDSLKSPPRVLPQDSPVKEEKLCEDIEDSPVKGEKLFEDIDLWNDNEYLLNYVTQKPNRMQEKRLTEQQAEEGDLHVDTARVMDSFGFSSSGGATVRGEPGPGFGFSTASKKPIAISEEAKRRADDLLSKFEQLEVEREVVENRTNALPPCNERGSTEQSAHSDDKAVFLGFTTASRKPIAVSEAAGLKADEILRQFEQEEQEQRTALVGACSTSAFPKPSTSHKKSSATSNERRRESVENFSTKENEKQRKSNELSDEVKQKAEELLKDIEFFEDGFEEEDKVEDIAKIMHAWQQTQPVFEGFKTASRKAILVSDDAKRRAGQLIRDVQIEDIPKDFLECIQADLKDDLSAKSPLKEQVEVGVMSEGFKTASKKPIQISEMAKRRAEQMLKDVQTDDLPQEFLECIQVDLEEDATSSRASKEQGPTEVVFEGFKTASKQPITISDTAKQRAEQIFKEIETTDLPQDFLKCIEGAYSVQPANVEKPSFEGFKTASKKPIQISNAARQRAEQLLKEIEADDLPPEFLECILSKPEFVCDPKVTRSGTEGTDHSPATNCENQIHHPPSCEAPTTQKTIEPTNRKTIKRKSEVFHAEDLLKSPQRRFSCNERTPLNGIENAPLHKTSSHPEIKSTPKISKKNLLSLNKRKKYNSPKTAAADISAGAKTPEKSDSPLLRRYASTTPNLKEFFDCVTTSTPRLIRTTSKVDANHKDSSIDGDFQKINWENASNSACVCKTSSFADLNVTCLEVSPSPKQRIERLKMYGEPPPISPILMVNKCRPSGLRRGRSLMKP